MPLVWNDSLATGIRQIDLQHQELIELINTLETASVAGHGQEAIDQVLPQLRAYVLFHFGTEEAMLGRVNAEHAQQHKQQHQEFTDKIAAVRDPATGSVDLSGLIEYLQRWLVEHIMRTDRELARQLPPSTGQ